MASKIKSFKDISTVHLKCRSLGHAWDVDAVFVETKNRRKVYRAEFYCLRCDTTRSDVVLAQSGMIDGRRYGYVENYTLPGGPWGGRQEFYRNVRLELIARIQQGGNRRLKAVK
jgi:hypothetical protein